MRKAYVLLLTFAVACWASYSLLAEPDTLPEPRPVSEPKAVPTDSRYAMPVCKYRGTSSCSATACHGQNGPKGSLGSEFSTWASYSPHARAYEVLFDEQAKQIVANYRRLEDKTEARPQRDPLCLKCHSLDVPIQRPGRADIKVLADGVGCESCHGGSERWKAVHYLPSWTSMSRVRKAEQGMFPTKDLAFRVRLCADCHIGNAQQEVNHDLIAAGHPRLLFEYSAFHQMLPKHWNENKNYGRDFLVRAWAIGQVASLRSRIALVRERAQSARDPDASVSWPEFAEYSCYGCHHNLDDSWRKANPEQKRKPGLLHWAPEYDVNLQLLMDQPTPFAPEGDAKAIATAIEELRLALEKPGTPPNAVVEKASVCLPLLDEWLAHLQLEADRDSCTSPLTTVQVDRFLKHMLEAPRSERDLGEWEWEQAAQHYLGIVAGVQSRSESPLETSVQEAIQRGTRPLLFTKGYNSPKSFTPKRYFEGLRNLRQTLDLSE